MNLLITNLAYGSVYSDLFLNQHLKSLLDQDNIPAFKDRLSYIIFTDQSTIPKIKDHPNYKLLKELLPGRVDIMEMIPQKFGGRYDGLITMFKESVKIALEQRCYLSCLVADLVMGQEYLQKVFTRLDEGYDSIFMLPLRSAMDPMVKILDQSPRALPGLELGMAGFENLHPLWVACHFESPTFTTMPFTLLWNSSTGLLARTFSITPIVFTPYPAMISVNGVIDVEVPHLCKNPYWCEEWEECPVIGVEPLFCYYPPFASHRASVELIGKEWTKCLHRSQIDYLHKRLFYPNKMIAGITDAVVQSSDEAIRRIQAAYHGA